MSRLWLELTRRSSVIGRDSGKQAKNASPPQFTASNYLWVHVVLSRCVTKAMAFLPTVPPRSTTSAPTRFSTPLIDFSGFQGLSDAGETHCFDVNSRPCSTVGGIFSQPAVRSSASCFLPNSSYRKQSRTVANQNVAARNQGKPSGAGSSNSGKFHTLPFSAVNKNFGGFSFSDMEASSDSHSNVSIQAGRADETSLVLPRWLPREESSVHTHSVYLDSSSLENKLSFPQKPLTTSFLEASHESHGGIEIGQIHVLWDPELDDRKIQAPSISLSKATATETKPLEQHPHVKNRPATPWNICSSDRQTRNFNYSMDALLKGGKAKECIDMFLSMPKQEVKRDVASWSIYITALGRLERYSEAESALAQMREEHVQPNIYTYSALIETLGRGGLCVRALCQFRRMTRVDNIRANTVTYNAVIKILSRCKRNDCGGITRAMSLFREMSSKGCIPDVVTYATLIDAFSKRVEPERALKLFEEMKEYDVKPNNYCYSSLISAFCRAGYVERALGIFEEMNREGIIPDVFAFNALIDGLLILLPCFFVLKLYVGFGKLRQVDKAFEIYGRMKKLEMEPDRITFNALISACGKAKNLSKALEAMRDMTDIYGLTPDRHSYNALIDACGKAGDFSKAYEIFEEMRANNIRPCTVTFNALIYGASRSHDLAAAFKIVDLMLREGLNPDAYTMNTLISACNRRQDLSTAFEVLEKFKHLGVHPDNVTFNTFIDAVGKLDSSGTNRNCFFCCLYIFLILFFLCIEKMFELLKEMESRGISPSKVTLNTIIGCCGRRGKLDLMERGFRMFYEKNLEPDSVTFALLIENYISHQLLDKAVAAYRDCKRQQLELSSNVVMHLVESLQRKGFRSVAQSISKDYPFLMRRLEPAANVEM